MSSFLSCRKRVGPGLIGRGPARCENVPGEIGFKLGIKDPISGGETDFKKDHGSLFIDRSPTCELCLFDIHVRSVIHVNHETILVLPALRMHFASWTFSSSHVARTLSGPTWTSSAMFNVTCTRLITKRSFHALRPTPPHRRPWNDNLRFRKIWWTFNRPPKMTDVQGLSRDQEDAAKAAILDKVMKGRQPTDLMLRCESPTFSGRRKP